MAADPVFIDTNVLVAASVSAHPSHGVASAYLARLEAGGVPACISGQVCREFLVVLTRQPVEGRAFSTDEALAALGTWLSACVVLEENEAVLTELLELVRRHDVKGKRARSPELPGRTHSLLGARTRPGTRRAAGESLRPAEGRATRREGSLRGERSSHAGFTRDGVKRSL